MAEEDIPLSVRLCLPGSRNQWQPAARIAVTRDSINIHYIQMYSEKLQDDLIWILIYAQ